MYESSSKIDIRSYYRPLVWRMPHPESPKSYFHFTAVEAFVANEDNFVKIMTFTSIYAIKSVSDQVLIGNSLIHQFLPVNAPHLTPSQKASIKENGTKSCHHHDPWSHVDGPWSYDKFILLQLHVSPSP